MIGITEITQETTKKVITAFLQTIQQKLLQGESINFKGYFTIKRTTTKPKGNKNCDEHHKELDKYKQTNSWREFKGLFREVGGRG